MVSVKNIGIPVKPPEGACNDKLCPFHGNLKVRGIILSGTVYKCNMKNTIVVRREYLKYVKKYKRHERRRSNIPAHCPPCIQVKPGEVVKIAECRPISKTVSFVVIERLGGEHG